MSRVAHPESGGGFVAQLRELLREYHAKRALVVAMLENAETAATIQNAELLLAQLDETIRDLERDIRRAERVLIRRHAPKLHWHGVRLDREISALRLQCVSTQPRRRGSAPRSRRVRTARTSHGPPGRSTDDPDLEGACPRCGAGVVVFRGIPTCAPCWASSVLAMEQA